MRAFIAVIFAAALLPPVPAGAFYAKSVGIEGLQLIAAKKETKKKTKKKAEEKVKTAPTSSPSPSY